MRSAEAALAALEQDSPALPANVILIHGPETYYHRRLIGALRRLVLDPALEAFNYTSFENESASLEAVRGAVLTPPVMAERRLVVVRDPVDLATGPSPQASGGDEDGGDDAGEKAPSSSGDSTAAEGGGASGGSGPAPLTKTEKAKRWASLLEEVAPDCYLVLALSRDLPASNRLLKAAAKLTPPADVIRCLPATPRSAEVWVRKLTERLGGRIDAPASQALVMRSGDDLTVLEREVEKLLAYSGASQHITRANVLAVATASAEASVFELVDLIGHRHVYPAVAKLRRLLEQGEPALRLLAMVVRQVRLVFIAREMIQAGESVKAVEKRLKLPTWVVKGYLAQARNFTREQLIEMMRSLGRMDLEIKTGRREAEKALELFILKMAA